MKNSPPILVQLLQRVSETSVPLELSRHIDPGRFKTVVISFFDDPSVAGSFRREGDPEIIGLGAKPGRLFRPAAIWRLYHTLRRIRPDIIHTHHNLSGSLGRLIARCLGVPVVVHTVHTLQSAYRLAGLLFSTATWGLADMIVCNSHNTLRSFYPWQKQLFPRVKTAVIYNGVDIAGIEAYRQESDLARREIGLCRDDFLIMNIGRCVWQKDQEILVRAVPAIVREISGAKIVIVGSGPLLPDLRELSASLKVFDKIIFTGLLPRDRVYKLLHSCDVFAMVSVCEGFCNAVVEAFAAEKPVVFTDASALPEVAGPAGVKVPVSDPAALAEAIIKLAGDPDKRRSLGLAGKTRVVEKFSLSRSIREYEELYLALLDDKKR